jgi:hypothetical protein
MANGTRYKTAKALGKQISAKRLIDLEQLSPVLCFDVSPSVHLNTY